MTAAAMAAACTAIAAACAPGCALMLGMESPEPFASTAAGSDPGGAGGAGGSAGAGGAGGASCVHRSWPERPDGVGGGDVEFWVAINSIAVQAEGEPVGLDLDGYCTCQGDESSCVPPGGGEACDDAEGVDNQLVTLFDALSLALGGADPAQYYSERASAGEWSLLLRISDYNGQANDPEIRLAWYGTYGFVGLPTWDGTDVWPIIESSVVPLAEGGDGTIDSPRSQDDHAYVADSTLVASLPADSELVLAGGASRMALRFTGALVTGTIHDEAGRWTLQDGLIAARLSEEDLFYSLSSLRDELGEPYCTDSVYYLGAKPVLCQARDILSTQGTASQPCDALAIGMGFVAWAALPGAVVPAVQPPPGCPPETDPTDDSCDP